MPQIWKGEIASTTTPGKRYSVRLNADATGTCGCKDYAIRSIKAGKPERPCKHIVQAKASYMYAKLTGAAGDVQGALESIRRDADDGVPENPPPVKRTRVRKNQQDADSRPAGNRARRGTIQRSYDGSYDAADLQQAIDDADVNVSYGGILDGDMAGAIVQRLWGNRPDPSDAVSRQTLTAEWVPDNQESPAPETGPEPAPPDPLGLTAADIARRARRMGR